MPLPLAAPGSAPRTSKSSSPLDSRRRPAEVKSVAATLFQVRIPKWARRHFGGKSRISGRFRDEGLGAAWQRRVLNQLEAIRQGVEAERAGIPQKSHPVALQPAAEAWLNSLQRRERTIESYRWALVHVFRLAGRTLLSDFGVSEWDDFVRRRRAEGATNDALKRERQAIQAASKWAAARGFAVNAAIFAIPKIKAPPVVVRRFDPDIMAAAIATLDGRDRVIAELVTGTGLRSAELRAARVEWIRWREHIIEVPYTEQFSPKGGRERRLPLAPKLERLLREWVGARRTGILFPAAQRGHHATGLSMQSLIRRLKAAGLPIVGLHDLRHHYISLMAALGTAARETQELAGHTSLKTTDRYMHVRPDYLKDARRRLATGLASGAPKRRAKRGKGKGRK